MTIKQHIYVLILILVFIGCETTNNEKQFIKTDRATITPTHKNNDSIINPTETTLTKKDSTKHPLITLSTLRDSDDPLVIRTYFNKPSDWKGLKAKINQTYAMGFRAYVDFLDNQQFNKLEPSMFINHKRGNYRHNFIFLADSITFSNPEHPIICVDLLDEIGKSFRVIPSEMWGVENNLSISNMYFYEFFDDCDADGIFRGF